MAENTLLEITQHVYDPGAKERASLFKLYEGKVRAIVGELFGAQSKFEIETPVAVAGVKGTDFETHHPKPCSTVYTQLGDSYARNVDPAIDDEVIVPGGFLTTICEGAKPTDPVAASEEFLEGTIPLRGPDTTRPGTPPMDGFPADGAGWQCARKAQHPAGAAAEHSAHQHRRAAAGRRAGHAAAAQAHREQHDAVTPSGRAAGARSLLPSTKARGRPPGLSSCQRASDSQERVKVGRGGGWPPRRRERNKCAAG